MWLAGVGGLCALAGSAYAVRGRSSTLLAPSVYHGARDRPAIALTFDDGPSESTPRILELLDQYQVRATFFQCGAQAERLARIAREVSAAGHEIGNHTHTHPRLWLRSAAFIAGEVGRAQQVLTSIHGAPPLYFRPPYGVRWFGLAQAQRRCQLLGVMWSTLGRDWTLPAPDIVRRLLAGAGNGAILVLHDGRELAPNPEIRETIDSVRRLLPLLQGRGFRFETVSQILCPTISSSASSPASPPPSTSRLTP